MTRSDCSRIFLSRRSTNSINISQSFSKTRSQLRVPFSIHGLVQPTCNRQPCRRKNLLSRRAPNVDGENWKIYWPEHFIRWALSRSHRNFSCSTEGLWKIREKSRSLIAFRERALHFKLYAFISITFSFPSNCEAAIKTFPIEFPFRAAGSLCLNLPLFVLSTMCARCYRNNNAELIFLLFQCSAARWLSWNFAKLFMVGEV